MKTVGTNIGNFNVVGVKPGFNEHVENSVSAFEQINEKSFSGKWKVIYFYPKDFTFVCPTEIVEFSKLNSEFLDRDTILMGGSIDNEFCKLAWRRSHKDLNKLNSWMFSDPTGEFAKSLGVLDAAEGVPLRATFIVNPDGVIMHVDVNALNVGRNPSETLRILDALQTGELCPCNRPVGGNTL